MRKYRIGITCFLASLLVVFVAGCGQETVTVPSVVSTVPGNGATNVVIGTTISATFSSAMNPASLTASTFTVTGPGGAAVAGAVVYSGLTATFTPGATLAYSSVYTATITKGATDPGGTPLIANYVWSFTTMAPPPAVMSTIPANGAANVPIVQALSATFSEAMSPASISASTFTVTGPGGAAVAGAVSYSGVTATFTPTASLAYSTVYTATITTGATNAAGTPLPANYVWSFTTITPPPLVVSTVPANGATGIPLTQVLTATFNEAMNCATLAGTAFTVRGPGASAVAGTVACAGEVATFTPAASLAVNTVYTATITTAAEDLAGTPLAANYVWKFRTAPAQTTPTVISTVPVNLATGVPTNQALSATFSVAMNPATIDIATFTLTVTGGASVTGTVSYIAAGSVATFMPAVDLASNTQYTATITTGTMDLEGVALAANYVWTFTTAASSSVAPPTVIATNPLNTAIDVPLNQVVSATFSKAMNPATINSSTFALTGPGATAVSGLVAYAAVGDTLTFTLASNLAPNTQYTATITIGAQDLAGTALANNYVWTFTTGAAVNVIPPEIVSTNPANGVTGVPLNQAVSATFSEAMDPLTISTATFQLAGPGGTAIAGIVSYDAIDFIATFTPAVPLIAGSTYTATVTDGATDLEGNPLGTTGAPNPWMFTTGAAIVPPPVVLGPTILLFGGFGGNAGMTNQGIHSVVNGDIGTTAASTLITGFYDESVPPVATVYPCSYTVTPLNMGLVNGAIDTAPPPPRGSCPNEGTATTMAIATLAALEAQTAYNTLKSLPPGTTLPTNELGNLTLAPGTYTSASFYDITAGPLTLDAHGDPNATWVFQMGTYLTVGTPSTSESIVLTNGAQAKNVYWQVGSAATINYGGGGTMVGTIISLAGTTVSSPGQSTASTVTTVNGRLIALDASVTIVNTVINVP
ncbi:MAG: Ig-like domain-containing protein [Terracidiphilus sp.]